MDGVQRNFSEAAGCVYRLWWKLDFLFFGWFRREVNKYAVK